MVRAEGCVEGERRAAHAERAEHLLAHDVVIGPAELALGLDRARADVAGGRGERIAVLIERAELRRGPHGRQDIELILRRRAVKGEEPLEILTGQARARADQVFHEDASGDVGVADLEGRVDVRHRRVPVEATLVDQSREHERRERLGVRGDHVQGVGGDGLVPPALANAEALFDERPVPVEERDRDARHVGRIAHAVDERLQLRDPRRVQRPGCSTPVRLADVPGRPYALLDQRDLRAPPLRRGQRAVEESDHRERALSGRQGGHPARFVGRGLVPGPAEQVPAFSARRVGGAELSSVEILAAARPGRDDGSAQSGRRVHFHELDLQAPFGILEGQSVRQRRHRPVRGYRERGTGRKLYDALGRSGGRGPRGRHGPGLDRPSHAGGQHESGQKGHAGEKSVFAK